MLTTRGEEVIVAKRFTDTDKWKKPFIRGLNGAYKLLWFYILDDCDFAGIWHVDFDVAQIRIGEAISKHEAIKQFGDRVEIFDDGNKWFLRDFIDFQYGELNPSNRVHASVIATLKKYNIGACMPLTRGQRQGQGEIQGTSEGEIQEAEKTREWFNSCLDDIFKETLQMTHKGKSIEQAAAEAWVYLSADKNRLRAAGAADVKKLVNTWMGNMKTGKVKSFNLSDI
jgi:hypothetical protein